MNILIAFASSLLLEVRYIHALSKFQLPKCAHTPLFPTISSLAIRKFSGGSQWEYSNTDSASLSKKPSCTNMPLASSLDFISNIRFSKAIDFGVLFFRLSISLKALLPPQSSMRKMPTASFSFEVNSNFPSQCSCGLFCEEPSSVTLRSAIYLNQWPKSHQEFIIASGFEFSFIMVSASHHWSFTLG